MPPLLTVTNLTTVFHTRRGVVHAVDGVSFSVDEGEVVGLVGESGCGKSATVRSLLRLIPSPPGRIVRGEVLYRGRDLLALPEEELRQIRGREVAMIFQDPLTFLNPVMPVGEQVAEVLREHLGLGGRKARERVVQLMRHVGIPSAETRLTDYPHQFSGGMRQRVLIAIALTCSPHLLLADEPTTALDVTVQDQILKLLTTLQREQGLAILLVTHDLGVVAQTCQRVGVMYAGKLVELAPTADLLREPRHPYTQGLLQSVPDPEVPTERLVPVGGSPPDLISPPPGCRFHPRCAFASDRCTRGEFPLIPLSPTRQTACIKHEELARHERP